MKRSLGIVFVAFFCFLLKVFFSRFPAICEGIYSNGLFLVFRNVYDYTLGLLPVPSLYVFGIVAISLLIHSLKHFSLKKFIHFFIRISALVVICFYIFWGYNYSRTPIEDKLNISSRALDSMSLEMQYANTLESAISARKEITLEETPLYLMNIHLEKKIRIAHRKTLPELNIAVPGRVRVRRLFKGSLLKIGTAGIYLPWIFEGHIDNGLHSLTQPYIMAHEMAHGIGHGDEGVCNFLAWLSCVNSDDPELRYSGHLDHTRELLRAFARNYPERFNALREEVPTGIDADINAILEQHRKFPDIIPTKVRDKTYDQYLKSQGVAEGNASYSRVVELVFAFQQANPTFGN